MLTYSSDFLVSVVVWTRQVSEERELSRSDDQCAWDGVRPMSGLSTEALTASKRRTVGQGSSGAGKLLGRWDGSKARAATKCSLPGLHEVVMGVSGEAGTLP